MSLDHQESGIGDEQPLSSHDEVIVTFLIAAYNAAETLAETLDSLLAQTDRRWSAVVVDDGSSDSTYSIAQRYAGSDSRITAFTQENAGAGMARNAAASHASGAWLSALDADDLVVVDAVERHACFIADHPGYDLYSWAAWSLHEDGTKSVFDASEEYGSATSFSATDLIERNRILSSTWISSTSFEQLGGFRKLYLEDYDLWLRALMRGMTHLHNPERLTLYRRHERGKSADILASIEATAEVLESLEGTAPGLLAIKMVDRAAYWRGLAASWPATEARHRLETALDAGDLEAAKSLVDDARPTYPDTRQTRFSLWLLKYAPAVYAWYRSLRNDRRVDSGGS